MRFLRNKRRLVGLGALGAFAALMMFVVLPALASNPGDFVLPASGAGVAPYDVAVGGTSTCNNVFTGDRSLGSVSDYANVNPKTKAGIPSGLKDGVTFDLTLGSNAQGQTLNVVAHGAAILGILIKGGNDNTAYNYKAFYQGGSVASDTALHAPAKSWSSTTTGTTTTESGSSFYTISQLDVCYTVVSYIEGNVYQDLNQNSANDDSSPRVGWTVKLYSDVTPGTAGGGTFVTSQQTTGANPNYHFVVPVNGTNYRVCEVPNAADPRADGGAVWVETQPVPSATTLCNGAGEAAKGYDVPSNQLPKSGADFGNVGGYACGGSSVGVDNYTVGTCKANQLYVFNSGTTNGAPFVDYWVGDPTKANIPVVERINFDDPFVNGQPKYTKLLYADGGGYPPVFNNLVQMPYCQLDPRTSYGNDVFTLQAPYDTLAGSTSVLPANATSCVISIKTVAPVTSGGSGKLQAFVYALGDSVRVGN